jgi:hypothetical protein
MVGWKADQSAVKTVDARAASLVVRRVVRLDWRMVVMKAGHLVEKKESSKVGWMVAQKVDQ